MPTASGFTTFPIFFTMAKRTANFGCPRLQQVNAQWLVLKASINQAIPEDFIQVMSLSRIKTVLDFNQSLSEEPSWKDLETLLRSYGRWGANYAILDQRPNSQSAWGAAFWKQANLVENYTRRFLRFCRHRPGLRRQTGPGSSASGGGDYWDLAFLEGALKMLSDSADSLIVNNTALFGICLGFRTFIELGHRRAARLARSESLQGA